MIPLTITTRCSGVLLAAALQTSSPPLSDSTLTSLLPWLLKQPPRILRIQSIVLRSTESTDNFRLGLDTKHSNRRFDRRLRYETGVGLRSAGGLAEIIRSKKKRKSKRKSEKRRNEYCSIVEWLDDWCDRSVKMEGSGDFVSGCFPFESGRVENKEAHSERGAKCFVNRLFYLEA